MTISNAMGAALNMVKAQRQHQDQKFGWIGSDSPDSALPKGDWHNDAKLTIITEELGEVADVLNEARHTGTLNRPNLHKELAQVAACAVAWIEADIELGRDPHPKGFDKPGRKTPGVGVCAIIKRWYDGGPEVLLVQREGAHGEGLWSFPGGWLEHGEGFKHAAVREVAEEVGLDVRADHIYDIVDNTVVEGVHCVTMAVYCEVLTDDPDPPLTLETGKVPAASWMPVKTITSLDLFAPAAALIHNGILDAR